MSSCDSLTSLPHFIHMKSLRTLHLNGCSQLKRFPEVSGEMREMLVLNINGCDRISALPPSIQHLTRLVILGMGKSYGSELIFWKPDKYLLSLVHISTLRALDLQHNQLEDFPKAVLNSLPVLEKLNLSNNNFKRLGTSFSQLLYLKYLNLSFCTKLIELPELPACIQVLRADGCFCLIVIEDLPNKYKWLFKISFRGCKKLEIWESVSPLASLLMKSFVQKCAAVTHQLSISLCQRTIPNWFTDRQLGDRITLNLLQYQITKIMGLAICCVFESWLGPDYDLLKVNFKSSIERELIDRPAYVAEERGLLWIGYMPIDSLQNLCDGFDYKNTVVSFESGRPIMECGVCVLYEDDMNSVTGNESWIPDYLEFGWIDHDSACKDDLQLERLSKPGFLCGYDKTVDNTEYVHL